MWMPAWLRNRLYGPQRADGLPEFRPEYMGPVTITPRVESPRLNLDKVESARRNLPARPVPDWVVTPAPGERAALAAAPVFPIRVATVADAGCWLDEANHGWRIGCAVVEIAVDRGWPITAEDRTVIDRYGAGDGIASDPAYVDAVVDDVVAWLTDKVAPPGYSFEFDDGSFYMLSDAAWCARSGDRCYCTDPHDEHGNPLPATAAIGS